MKMMQESLTSRYNKLMSLRHEDIIIQNLEEYFSFIKDLCTQTAVTLFFRPQFSSTQKLVRKLETLVSSTMIDTQSSQSNHGDTFFSIYYWHFQLQLVENVYLMTFLYYRSHIHVCTDMIMIMNIISDHRKKIPFIRKAVT